MNLAGQLEGQLQWQAASADDVQTRGHVAGHNVRVLYGSRVDLRESEVQMDFATQGRLQQRNLSELSSAQLQFQASGDQLLINLTGPVADPLASRHWPLQLRCTGQLASWRQRLQTLVASPLPQLAGWLEANVDVLADPSVLDVTSAEVTLKDLTLLKPDGQMLWTEPIVQAHASGRYDVPRSQIDLSSLNLRTDSAALQVAGAIHNVTQECDLRLTGQIQYDLQRLSNRMRQSWGDQVQLTGQGATVHDRGSVSRNQRCNDARCVAASRLRATLDPRWTDGTGESWLGYDPCLGIQCGCRALLMYLEQQHLSFEPLTLPVSGGQMHLLRLRVRLGANPVVELDRGRSADRIQMTPEMCHGWLRTVPPMLADTTCAEGLFSVELDGLRLPLLRPNAASALGTLLRPHGASRPRADRTETARIEPPDRVDDESGPELRRAIRTRHHVGLDARTADCVSPGTRPGLARQPDDAGRQDPHSHERLSRSGLASRTDCPVATPAEMAWVAIACLPPCKTSPSRFRSTARCSNLN